MNVLNNIQPIPQTKLTFVYSRSFGTFGRYFYIITNALLILMSLAVTPSSYSATYYVSPTGSDSNAGDSDQPWSTIQKCADSLNPGDICIVKPGNYREHITIVRSGSNDSSIEIRAEVKHETVINGSLSVSGNYVKLNGFKVFLLDGGRIGISVTGSNNELMNAYVTTLSNLLGLNNTGIGVGGDHNIVKGNYVENVCFGYGLSGTGHIFEGNEAYQLRLNGNCGDVDYMRFFGTDHIIKNNFFHGIKSSDVGSAHVDCFQTFDNGGPSYSIRNILVEGNYCSDAAQGMMLEGKIYKQSRGLVVRNNVFTTVGAWCVCLVDIADVHFLNNTCDTTAGIHGIWCRGKGNIASCEFKNNIIYGPGSLYGVFETATLIDGTPDAPGKANLLYKPGTTISGYFQDIKNQDPLFLNPSAGNYKLRNGSPAIDAGLALSGFSYDIERTPRPQGYGWDIGAYEFIENRPASPKNLRIVGPD